MWPIGGFSITELITAVGLMGLLTSIAVPFYLEYRHSAVIDKMMADSNAVKRKISLCFKYAELHDCVDPNDDKNCDPTERFNARWDACYASGNPGMVKLGLIPCTGAQSISSACDTLQGNSSSKVMCVTLKWKEQHGCVRYDANSNQFTVCVDPEKPGSCLTTCQPKKGYKCDGSLQCVCA
ncbi:MAG: hypothetical protein OXB86_06810 [Bdellovibrionales bacterium]|nr:hypothetical protein [Bdellovibrionales bacterium]